MLPVAPVALPLLFAAALAALTKIISQRFSQLIAVGATLTSLAIDIYLLKGSATHDIVYWFGNWRIRDGVALGISFTIDPFGAGLAGFAAVLTLAALLFSSEFFDTAGNHFHALLLAFLAAMSGFSLTGDMFNMFVFFELMSAAAFALCGYKTADPGSLQGTLNFAVTNTIAAYFVLTGIGLLYARTGALNMAQMGRALSSGRVDTLVLIAFVFVICGYLVKTAIVPFHFWLADAHAVAPSPVCVLFSGVMVDLGLFALARIYWATFNPVLHAHLPGLTTLFVSIGVATALTGAFMCYLQRNVKRLLAFSTISHVGLIMTGVALFAPAGLAGAAIYALAHGMVKGGLFLAAGILLHRFQSVDEHDLYGKARREPATAAVFFAGAVGLTGFPFSGLAAGHDLMSASAKSAGFDWLRWIFIFADGVTAAAALRAGGRIFFGWGPVEREENAPKHEEKPETEGRHQYTPATMFIPACVLVVGGLLVGFVPDLKQAAIAAATQFENSRAYAASVLDSQYLRTVAPAAPEAPEMLPGLLALLGAIVIALVHLFSARGRQLSSALWKPLRLLHRLHSGHVGDYVAFLTFGMACFALLCVYCFS
ncbi:MAG TPA: complex I subunit 5 family protein [Bryobacteraceae bacterium]|jgi:multicomponent Na+:H+ antiporter subunit D|nr:complex I subunit 5 family protein [Bryobacteraceae bacterium]